MKIKPALVVLLCSCLCLGGVLSAAEQYRAKLFTRGGPNTENVVGSSSISTATRRVRKAGFCFTP